MTDEDRQLLLDLRRMTDACGVFCAGVIENDLCEHLAGEPENRDQVENTAVTWASIERLTDFIPVKHIYPPILDALGAAHA